MQSSSFTTQLTNVSDTLKQTNALITRLATLTFSPGSEPLSSQTTVRLELANDIHDTLKQLQEDLDLLALEAEDLNQPSTTTASITSRSAARRDSGDRARLSSHFSRLQSDLRTSHSAFRRAQLAAKKSSETAKQHERELLFSRLSNPAPPSTSPSAHQTSGDLFSARRPNKQQNQKQLSKDELEVDASQTITTSLRRTHALLTTELSRSRFAQETFDASTAALAELGEGYNSLDSVLKGSRELLGTLLRSQKSDTWYLESALYVLLATLCWLFVHRILWGPFYQLPSFLWRWLLWPILCTFLSVTGVYNPNVTASRSLARPSTTRPPLIIQPSAKHGSQPKFPEGMEGGLHVPAGGGGVNAKVGKVPLEGRVSEGIGKMVEESEERLKEAKQEEGDGVVRRGDGTVLEERGPDEPVNPKKRIFEAGVDGEKQREKDEL